MVNDTRIVSEILITCHIMALNTLSLPFVIPLTVATSHALVQMQRDSQIVTIHFMEEGN